MIVKFSNGLTQAIFHTFLAENLSGDLEMFTKITVRHTYRRRKEENGRITKQHLIIYNGL